MPHPADDITRADRHYVTLILRLTLDRTGQLLQGELVDTTDTLRWRLGSGSRNNPVADDSSANQDSGN
jgi:hypothetical protein